MDEITNVGFWTIKSSDIVLCFDSYVGANMQVLHLNATFKKNKRNPRMNRALGDPVRAKLSDKKI